MNRFVIHLLGLALLWQSGMVSFHHMEHICSGDKESIHCSLDSAGVQSDVGHSHTKFVKSDTVCNWCLLLLLSQPYGLGSTVISPESNISYCNINTIETENLAHRYGMVAKARGPPQKYS